LTNPLVAHEPSNPPENIRQFPEKPANPDSNSAMSESVTIGTGRIKFRAFFGRIGLEWEIHKRFRRY
jgi:hypothetical protein